MSTALARDPRSRPLLAEDFGAFFEGVHGYPPFAWQTQLAEHVVNEGRWPSLLDLPTAAGKTAVIDIAVFHLACEAAKGPARRAPVRILFVIDRRIVVDAAAERATKIARALADVIRAPSAGIVSDVARNLALLSTSGSPLDVVRLRGGTPQERDWARSPGQPLVAVSTVDQVGSRLLFRGYGVSRRMWPVHAGLVGADALWLLDEVHLSRPLEETLDAIAQGHCANGGGVFAEQPRLAPFSIVKLSATPGAEAPTDRFPPTRAALRTGATPAFLDRLMARKEARLEVCETDPAETFSREALRFAGLLDSAERVEPAGGGKRERQAQLFAPRRSERIGVVVNRVGLARRIFDKLVRVTGEQATVLLLTGRVRPIDRERILADLAPLQATESRAELERPVILVATQTIEAGADLDFDALVTEIAPFDSLRQRFGQLDRLGKRKRSEAVIVYPPGKPTPTGSDRENAWDSLAPIYGSAPYATKQWLQTLDPKIDFGISASEKWLAKLSTDALQAILAPRAHAPVLFEPYVRLWATTSPPASATPELSLFLHGPAVLPDVQVVWRADSDVADPTQTPMSLVLCPPSALEAMAIPIWTLRGWMTGQATAAVIADVPERSPPDSRDTAKHGTDVWRHNGERWEAIPPTAVKPGDLVVVPTIHGGCDRWGWAPQSAVPVIDHGTEAHYLQRGKAAIRVNPAVLENDLTKQGLSQAAAVAAGLWARLTNFLASAGDDVDADALRSFMAEQAELPRSWLTLLQALPNRGLAVRFHEDADRFAGFVLYSRLPLKSGLFDGTAVDVEAGAEATTARDDSSSTGVEVSLADHHKHVETWAREYASRAGLPAGVVELIATAARAHDLGKADARFQADLRGFSALFTRDADLARVLLAEGEPLAKSNRRTLADLPGSTHARAAPEGFRHEAMSVALAQTAACLSRLTQEEKDLVLWLIGTHHGYGRPFFPSCLDPDGTSVVQVEFEGRTLSARADDVPLRLDHGWFELAERVNRRYGPWELARLEAILRLADHAASAAEQEPGADAAWTLQSVRAIT